MHRRPDKYPQFTGKYEVTLLKPGQEILSRTNCMALQDGWMDVWMPAPPNLEDVYFTAISAQVGVNTTWFSRHCPR
jgi:hypothetical protein